MNSDVGRFTAFFVFGNVGDDMEAEGGIRLHLGYINGRKKRFLLRRDAAESAEILEHTNKAGVSLVELL